MIEMRYDGRANMNSNLQGTHSGLEYGERGNVALCSFGDDPFFFGGFGNTTYT
jgi:hypothetical protein